MQLYQQISSPGSLRRSLKRECATEGDSSVCTLGQSITLAPHLAGNTTEFSAFGGPDDEPSANMIEMAMADVTEGFDWYKAAPAMGDVTRGVPSLGELATADEVRGKGRKPRTGIQCIV